MTFDEVIPFRSAQMTLRARSDESSIAMSAACTVRDRHCHVTQLALAARCRLCYLINQLVVKVRNVELRETLGGLADVTTVEVLFAELDNLKERGTA